LLRPLIPFVFFVVASLGASGALFAQSEERPPTTSTTALPSPQASAAPSPEASPTVPPAPYNRLNWRSIGPAISGGRVAVVVGSARNPKLYYLGAAGGGVWKTTDGGASWKAVFDAQHVASIGAIALDPQNDDVVWVGTGETNPRNDVIAGAGLYRSGDGGKTWQYVGLRDTEQISKIAIDPHDPRRLVVGTMGDFFRDTTARGVYRTSDGGKTWTKTLYLGPASGASDLAVDPLDFNVMYAGMWHFRRLPWTFTSGGPDDGIFKSVDAGATWQRLTGNGLPTGITGRIGLAVAPSDPKRVYALIESKDGILWRSSDAGASWTLVSHDTLADQRPFYFTHVAVDPKNAEHVYAVSEMLSESKDGGASFHEVAKDAVHVDYHSIWIAPNDPTRIMVGEDGGFALTLDREHWSFSENLPIGEVYHVGYDDGTPYRVCASLQDNSAFCGPSSALDSSGNSNRNWESVVGGDGVWAWPDPTDPNIVWSDSQDGSLALYDRTSQRNTSVQPWFPTAAEAFDSSLGKYRFNWSSPIAFAPWDPHTVWFGGNVVFATSDRGATWQPISPDLTRDDKAHQQPSGGPLAFDVSGAEYSDTILDIEGSTLARGEIWVGTDDGLVQVTRDGGAQWHNVTPPGTEPYGRFEIVAPSTLRDGTAYAALDRHFLGDRKPYAFVTHDFGAHWTSIATGLPKDEPVRAIRPDTREPNLVYAGVENGLYLSYDGGLHWRPFDPGLPPAPVYDVRIQPRWNDLLLATHGRSLYVFDDLAPVQGLPAAQRAGAELFAPRPAYAFSQHGDEENTYTNYYAKNAALGASLSFYQDAPAATPPAVRIYDAHHTLVRTIAGERCAEGKPEPFVTNDRGLNRTSWNLREDGPVRWNGAAREAYKGARSGPLVLPGTYTVEMTLGGRTFARPLTVRSDPRVSYTAAQNAAAHAFAAAQTAKLSAVDAALNRLDGTIAAAQKKNLPAIVARAQSVRAELTADYHNDEDSIGRPGKLRENLLGLDLVGDNGPPTAAALELAARIDVSYAAVMADVAAFFATDTLAAPPLGPRLDCATDED
jgi:photosystem II stability/assembly factor-like uncharacterized protein